MVSAYIQDLCLKLAVEKTEAVMYKSQYRAADVHLRIQGQAVPLGMVPLTLKYLDIVLENMGTMYDAHFRATVF